MVKSGHETVPSRFRSSIIINTPSGMAVVAILILVSCLISVSKANYTFIDYASNNVEEYEVDDDECSGKHAIKAGVLHLLNYIAENYLKGCVNVILYDKNYEESDERLNFDLEKMLTEFPGNYINGQVRELKRIPHDMLTPVENECRNFILLLTDITWTVTLLGPLRYSRVVVVTVSSRWKIEEYLQGWQARDVVNLLIVSYNWKQNVLFSVEEMDERVRDINLYTHKLYTDGLGSSTYRLLTSWRCGKLTRDVDLFPKKMSHGFNGRQFVVAASEQPPFTFKKRGKATDDANESHLWDGVEIRLLRLLSNFLNYTIEIIEPKMATSDRNGPSERVIAEVVYGEAEIGSAGVYVTNERITQILFSAPHTTDCAAFITKASTALPGHRAILGPFQWTVWLALTMTYMSAIIPLTFADSHSLKPLMKNPWLIESMFWHVFGTFTNCFTFSEEKSWTKSKKSASRLFVGWYWAFTIIVTACYTGSIVSFITLFVSSNVIDTLDELVAKNFRIGTLSTGGWARWFNNSEHDKTKWLLRDVELVPNTTQGLLNVSHSYYLPMFRPYAFLAGRAQMEYIVQANYTSSKDKEMLHITKECFVPFIVSYVFPSTAAYSDLFSEYILRVQQSGLMAKLLNEFKWEVERSSTGKLLRAGTGTLHVITPRQRKLNLSDTEGMYLLMGAGYLIGLVVLITELIHHTWTHRKRVTLKERLTRLLFWRSERFRSMMNRLLSFITPYIERVYKRKETREDENNYTSFKKYDSRILGSQASAKVPDGLDNPAFFSDWQLNRKASFVLFQESKSLPDMTKDRVAMPVGDEQTDLNPHRRKDLDIVFGSINSLPWDIKNTLHRRNSRTLDSAQSY